MKTTARVFIILGMIFQFYLIFPIVVGIISLVKLSNAKSKSDLIAIGVVTLILCNAIAGILMLSMPETLFENNQNTQKDIYENVANDNNINENIITSNQKDNLMSFDKLEILNKMKQDGLISDEEFVAKKIEILKEI